MKFHAWEEQFIEQLDRERADECAALKTYRLAYVSTVSAGKGFPPVCAMLTRYPYCSHQSAALTVHCTTNKDNGCPEWQVL